MTRNIKTCYSRLTAPKVPGILPYDTDFIVYVRKTSGSPKGKICADRKFKIKEAAQIYFDSLPDNMKE